MSPEFILDSIKDNLNEFHTQLVIDGVRVDAITVDFEGYIYLRLKDGRRMVITSEP